jgi:glucose-1-phosphate adenylyltransferase
MPRKSTATIEPKRSAAKVVTFVLAGGLGTRLGALTAERPKPLLPVANRRLIDFTLSNCAHSDLDDVSVLTQYRAGQIAHYLDRGAAWGLDSDGRCLRVLHASATRPYAGTADAVRQHLDDPGLAQAETVVVLAADHVYAMDYSQFVEQHHRTQADVTIGVVAVAPEDAPRFGIADVDAQGFLRDFEEKPSMPRGNLASMGIYVFGAAQLRQLLGQAIEGGPVTDFGADVLPLALRVGMRLGAMEFTGYWRDVGTPDAYLDVYQDLIQRPEVMPLADSRWPVLTRSRGAREVEIGATALVRRSLVLGGAKVQGILMDSAVLRDVRVDEGAIVRNSVLLDGVRVERGAIVDHAVIDRGATVRSFARVGTERSGAVTVVAAGSTVGPGRSAARVPVRGNRPLIA